MNQDEPTRKPTNEGKTQEFLDRTVDSNFDSDKSSDIHGADMDATLGGSDTGSGPGSNVKKYSEIVGDQIGPYLLVEELGSGGMGTVYRAEQSQPVKREVALKIIKAGMDTDRVIARFEAERQALSLMEHPNIARVLDANATDRGRPYFVMELVRGQAVTSFCDEHKLSIEARLRLFCKICNAIQHAHQKGIIHRDLKPSNILVAMPTGQPTPKPIPKVIDFGVAKATNQQLTEKTMFTQQGQVVGTLEYMSPEQAQMTDANVDTRTDIYSLGVILYELLTGNTPLNRSSISQLGYVDILNRIKDQEAVKPSSRLADSTEKSSPSKSQDESDENSSASIETIAEFRSVEPRKLSNMLRGDLDWIVLKALDKEPARRYETAAGFADDIERYLNAEPIDARPPTALYLWGKFAKRHKVAVTAGAVVLATLIAGIFLTTSQWIRARAAEETVANQMQALRKSITLEKENAALQRESQKRNETVKAKLSGEIRFLAQFGRWSEVLSEFESYEQQFGEAPLQLEILRLTALDGLAKSNELRQSIVRLESHPEAADFKAQLQLWRGYVFLTASDEKTDARSLIKQAIDSNKLEISDQLFAEGLIQDSFNDAQKKYLQALEESPFHSQARMQLIVTLILLGRYEDGLQHLEMAKTMFPDDVRYLYAEVVLHSLAAKRLQAVRARKRLRERSGENVALNLNALGRLSVSVHNQFQQYDRDGLLDWFSIMRKGFTLFQEDSYRSIPVPEFQKERVFSAYGTFAQSFLNPLMRIARKEKKHRMIIENCQTAWKIHEDGIFKCFEGWSWFALKDYKKAAAAFDVASTSDGLFPEIKNQGLYGAFISRKEMFDNSDDRSDRRELRKSMNYLEQHLANRFESHRAMTMFSASAEAGRWELSQMIADEMIKREGGMEYNWSMILLREAEQRKNLGLALSVCDRLLKDAPNNPALINRRRTIVDKIGKTTDTESK